jgi:hypothetical protein
MVVTASMPSTAAHYTITLLSPITPPPHPSSPPYTPLTRPFTPPLTPPPPPLHTPTPPLTPPCSGTFECFVKKADDGREDPRGKLVLTYAEGATFGELALMYNTPRAASIVASSDSVLWAMDRETFRTVILQVEWYVVSSE